MSFIRRKRAEPIRQPSSFPKFLFSFPQYASAHLPLYMQASQHPRNKSAPPSQPELSEHRSFSEDACSFRGGTTCQRDVFSVIIHEHVHFRAVLIIYYNTYCILDISVFDSSRMPSTLKFLKIILFCAFPYFSVT